MRPTAAGRRFAVIIGIGTKANRFFWPRLLMEISRREDESVNGSAGFTGTLALWFHLRVASVELSAPVESSLRPKSFGFLFLTFKWSH